MTIFGLSLLQVFFLVLTMALAIVGAEQIRTHVLNPLLTKARAWLAKTEATVEGEFETLLGHAKATVAALPGGTTVEASNGNSAVTISTPKSAPAASGQPITPLDPAEAVKRYLTSGMTPAAGMPTLAELLYIFGLAKPAQVAWGVAVAAAFGTSLPSAFTPVTVGDVGAIRPEAAAYLTELSQGYPIVGSFAWTKA